MISEFFNKIIDMIYALAAAAMMILPDSPIQKFMDELDQSVFSDVIGIINYFVPIDIMLGLLSVYLVAVGIWYVVRWFLRLAQYID